MTMHKYFLIFLYTLMITLTSWSQDKWSLERCIQRAIDNNIQLKQNKVQTDQAALTLQQSKLNQLPSLSGSSGYSFNFGRNVDPLTNSYKSEVFSGNNWGISSGALLYGGGQIRTNIALNNSLLEERKLRNQQSLNEVQLNVVLAFMNILFEEERLNNSQAQLAISQSALERMMRLIQAGAQPENARYDLEAQIALNEQSVVGSENNLTQALLSLKTLLLLDADYNLVIERPEIEIPTDVDPDIFTFADVYRSALNTQPSMQADEWLLKSSQLAINLAKTQLQPTLSLGGSVNTAYSNKGLRVVGTSTVRQPFDAIFNNDKYTFEVESTIPITDKSSYWQQFSDNLGYGLGLNLNIPIYNRGSVRTRIKSAELDLNSTALQVEQNKENLKATIQRAIADAKASKRAFNAAQKTLDAQKISYENIQKRLDLGSANTYELIEAKNRFDSAANSLIINKYDYLFRLKVIDYYLGKPLKI